MENALKLPYLEVKVKIKILKPRLSKPAFAGHVVPPHDVKEKNKNEW